MSRALSVRRLSFFLLVTVLEIQAYAPRTATNFTRSGENEVVTINPVISELLVETSTSGQEDQDPAESSETIVYNRFQNPPGDDEEQSDSEEDPEGPPDHVIPYSEHEEPRNVPTKPKYNAPGEWAKPARVRDVSQEDVPMKLLAQVRRTHTVRRLPRKEAIKNAESDEERENAARLREVVKNSKVNTVYTEEGYEDSAYDHAGHVRDADFHEGYARKLHDQMDLRKKSEDDEDKRGEESSTKLRKYKKIDPEEFKDYDEDYRDYHETTTDYNRLVDGGDAEGEDEWNDPKVVAEEGIQKLQVDLENEAGEIEKVQDSIQQENLAESQKDNTYQKKGKKRRKGKKQKKPIASTQHIQDYEENLEEALEESQAGQNDNVYVENYSTMRAPVDENGITERGLYRTTAVPEVLENSSNNPSGLYSNEVEGNVSPYPELIDFQQVYQNPTTVSYSQLFWDYFKARLNQFPTVQPVALESTTSSPNLLQGASFLEYGFSPIYGEQTTSFPITESSILSPQKLVAAQSLTNPEYLKNPGHTNHLTSVEEVWQPITTNAPPTTSHAQLLETPNSNQAIFLSDSIKNLASQESIKSFDNPFLNPFTNRKPRYKITIRQKSKKPTDSVNFPKEESSTSINDTPSESPVTVSDGYMKVLMHLRNEDNAKNLYSGASQSSFLSSVHDEPKDLTRMRPPVPQKATEVGYQNFLPRKPVENESPWTQSQGRANHRAPRGNSFPGARQAQSGRKRNSMPATDLLPPLASSASEYVRYKEANDYLTDTGNWLKQSRNVLRPFRQASIGFDAIGRVKRRERRSTGSREDSDESRGVVKVAELLANNGTSNRGEIDQSAKNRRIERNLRTAAMGVEVGPALDKLSVQKKSRSSATDRGVGFPRSRWESVTEERESSGGTGLEESLRKSGGPGDSLKTLKEVEEKSVKRRSMYGGRSHEELLDESPKIADEVINKEINARFNENEKGDDEDSREKKVEVEVPDFDYVEELPEEDRSNNVSTTESTLNLKKYPFYKDERLPSPSALRYAEDPGRIPRKTYGGMEFYDSRDAYKHCDEVEPKLDVLPKKEEPVAERGPNENLPRIRGLGDKLDCYKAKYFDEDPFDNPLFLEKEVEEPTAPIDFDTKQFASRIMLFPKKDDDYVVQKSSKKPESYSRQRRPDSTKASSVRVQKPRIIRYKTYPKTVRPSRPRVYRIRSSKTRYVKAGRPQKVIRRPIGSASELSSLYTPYQNQVYEDVMGTIKNMANSYQVYETTTTPSSEEAGVTDKGSKEDQTNTTANSTSREEKGKDIVSIKIVKPPNKNADINIQGLMPPKYLNRHRTFHERNRVPQNGKVRIQMAQKPLVNHRVVNRRQKIRIYKRDARDEENEEPSIEVTSLEKKIDRMKSLFNSEESGGKEGDTEYTKDVVNLTTEGTNISLEDSTTLAPVPKSPVFKRKSKVPKTVSVNVTSSTDEKPKKEMSKKVVYTIRDRIRHLKPKGEVRRTGKFVNETKVEEDSRRKEPKYNYIRRKKPSTSVSTTPEVSSLNSTNKIDWTKSITVPEVRNQDFEVDNGELAKENREIQYVANNAEVEQLNSPKDPENLSKKGSLELSENQTSNKTENGYAVHENVNETSTQEPPEISKLKAFLESDPPGYAELSSKDLKTSYFPQSNNSKDFIANLESVDPKQSSEKEEDDNASKNYHKPYFSDEESSEKLETNTKDQPSTESSEETNASSKRTDSEEDRTFFTFASRPTSPAENYEDERYSDLGPRVSKPAFFHPRFSFESKTNSEEYSKEAEDNDEEKEEYVFPWYRDTEDDKKGKRDRYRDKSIGEYEYPWERRERLAQEARRKQERKRKRLAKSLEDEEEDEDTFTRKYRRNAYPRGRYRFWGRMKENSSEEDASDNVESSSEPKPVMKYSSRYNSKNATLPLNEKSTNVRSRSVEVISRSIKKALEGDSKESSKERKSAGSLKNRGASRGIVPEDVTLAPTRRDGRKEILKPPAVNSTEAVVGRNLLKNEEGKGRRSSSTLAKNTLDNVESRLTVVKANDTTNSTNEVNSTRQSNKKRRRPLKNVVSLLETTTKSVVEVNRSRRRQKPAVTSPDTVISTSSTTSAPMVVRRKHPKSAKDLKKKTVPKIEDTLKDSDKNKTDTSGLKNRALEHRSRESKENKTKKSSETIEKLSEPKNLKDEELQKKDSETKEGLSKHNNNQSKIVKSDNADRKSKTKEKLGDDARKTAETESEQKSPSAKDKDESFDFKDDRDFDRSDTIPENDYDDEFGGILKSDNHVDDSLVRTVSAMPVKNLQIKANEGSRNISGQKENNRRKSVKIELLQGQENEEKRNGNTIEGKKRESTAKFVKDPQQRLYYYVERRK